MTSVLRTFKNTLATASFMAMSYTQVAVAQFAGPTPNNLGLANSVTDEDSVRELIIRIITIVLNFLALIAVIVIIIAGIRLIVSQGEDDAKDKAKKTILYAIIGLVVVLFARFIVTLITGWLASQTGGTPTA